MHNLAELENSFSILFGAGRDFCKVNCTRQLEHSLKQPITSICAVDVLRTHALSSNTILILVACIVLRERKYNCNPTVITNL